MAEMINFYDVVKKTQPHLLNKAPNPNKHLHGFDTPFRMVVCAPSGAGKTSFVLNMLRLFCAGKGTFAHVYIVTKDKEEPLYTWLEQTTNGQVVITEGLASMPKLDSFKKGEQTLVCFDDLVLSSKKELEPVEQLYIRGRKLGGGVSVCFLTQSWFRTPKTIRINCSYIVILKLASARDAGLLLSDFALGVSKEELMRLYEIATSEKMTPLIIDVAADREQRFRKGFDTFI